MLLLSYYSVQLGFQVFLQFGHNSLNLLVVQGLVGILQDKAYGIRFLAFGNAFALIDSNSFFSVAKATASI